MVADSEFPHTLTITLPLPSPRIAETISSSLSVDAEISSLVNRTFSTDGASLIVNYAATTARMLRVSTNGIFESIKTLLKTFAELDVEELNDDFYNGA